MSQSEIGSFSSSLWAKIGELYAAILRHPFVRGLSDGSLSRESFRFYVVQDALYLREFARALSIAAAKAPEESSMIMFNQHAAGALEVERALHEGFFRDFGMHPEQVTATRLAPTNLAYTSYLLAIAYGRPFHELLGALLPCYWIYWEVGKELEKTGSTDELYRRWIKTYAAEDFGKLVRAVIDLTDGVAGTLTAEQRSLVTEHFVTTSQYEWMFWEMGFRREKWPV